MSKATLKARITTLKARTEALEARIAELEAQLEDGHSELITADARLEAWIRAEIAYEFAGVPYDE